MTNDERFTILVVCHANLCRSPMGERLARRALGRRLGPDAARFEITSAGTHAWSNQAMHPYAEQVLKEHGIDPAGFRSRRLTEVSVRSADLVLTATRSQRAACVTFDPAAVRRTFTIPQFGRYAAALSAYGLCGVWPPQRRPQELLDQLAVVRGEMPVAPGEEDDLADPVKRPVEEFRRCAERLLEVFDLLTRLIAPIPPPARHRLDADSRTVP